MITDLSSLRKHLERGNIVGNDFIAIITIVRNQLETSNQKGKYKWLNLFCNWCVHPKLSASLISIEVINSFLQALFQSEMKYTDTLPDFSLKYESDVEHLSKFFDSIFNELRHELISFFVLFQLEYRFFEIEKVYARFLILLLNVIKSRPLYVPENKFLEKKPKKKREIEEVSKRFTRYLMGASAQKSTEFDFAPTYIGVIHNSDGSFGIKLNTKKGTSIIISPIMFCGMVLKLEYNEDK